MPYGKLKTYRVCTWRREDGKLMAVIGGLPRTPWPGCLESTVEAYSGYDAKLKARRHRQEHERAREATK